MTRLPFAVTLLATLCSQAAQNSNFYLKDGDRVVFYGDSITDQRLYTTFTETYVVTRFPKMDVTFVHSGWGGDRVTGGGGGDIDTRLKRDVFVYKPTVMTIMLGMNDASYKVFDQGVFKTYTNGYEHIIASLKQNLPDLRLTLIRPSPFDDVTRPPKFEGGYNAVLVRYGDFVQDLAGQNGATVADLNAGVVAAVKKAHAKDPEMSIKLNEDRVHPGPAGQLLMANELLKAWKAPSVVSDVSIDVSSKRADATQATVSNLKADGKISWKQLDSALPFPMSTNDPVMALAISSSDVMDALNKETLRVTGLEGESYKLRIDGTNVATFSRDDLSKGINLARFSTPMMRQAGQVHALTVQHNDLHFKRWREIQVPLLDHKNPKIAAVIPSLVEALDEEEVEIVKKQRQTAQPKPRLYELLPVN
jgi:lysophospholipase L1-like esterase